MPTAPKLLASYFTVAGAVDPFDGHTVSPHSLQERAEAAAGAGYVGLGLLTSDLIHCIEQHGYAEMRRILAGSGIQYLEFEVLQDWFADGPRRTASDMDRRLLLEAAEKLGAYQIKVVGDATGIRWPTEYLADSFRQLCREAAEIGTQISIEIYPGSMIRDLPTAIGIVEGAAASNGGLLLDIWHFHRGGIPYEDMSLIPSRYIKHIELDDAAEEVVGTILEDTLNRRKLPGEGSLDVPRFLGCIAATGYDGLYGVEILSEEHRRLSLVEAARRSFDATMRQFALADLGRQQ